MSCNDICFPYRYAWSSDYERDVDVLLKTTLFSGVEAMLRDVIAVVCGVEYVGIFKNSIIGKSVYEAFDQLVNCLQSL
jgi:hypothetical protein